jgi:tetratricopeptide (TPR) repeat protein
MTGDIAMAERRYDDAVRAYRDADKAGCQACSQPDIGRAYDLAGKSDSAIAVLTRYIEQFPDAFRLGSDAWNLAGVHKRLGELYEAKGDKQKAAGHYVKFLELWKNADPELQPKVDEVRKRLARISDTEKR